MDSINFTPEEKANIVEKIQNYFISELYQEIGQFDAEFLLDFFSKEIGSSYYNKGLSDARIVVQSKIDDIDDALYEIEK